MLICYWRELFWAKCIAATKSNSFPKKEKKKILGKTKQLLVCSINLRRNVTLPGGSCRRRQGRAASTTRAPPPQAHPPSAAAQPAAPPAARHPPPSAPPLPRGRRTSREATTGTSRCRRPAGAGRGRSRRSLSRRARRWWRRWRRESWRSSLRPWSLAGFLTGGVSLRLKSLWAEVSEKLGRRRGADKT